MHGNFLEIYNMISVEENFLKKSFRNGHKADQKDAGFVLKEYENSKRLPTHVSVDDDVTLALFRPGLHSNNTILGQYHSFLQFFNRKKFFT